MKKKLGILLDSFVGIPKNKIEEMGYHMVPLQFSVDGITYVDDGINPTGDEMLKMLENAKEAFTSLPSLGLIEQTVKEMSKEYDDVIALPINSSLSSTYNTIAVSAKNYSNFHVIDNHLCGDEFIWVAQELQKRYQEGQTIDQLKVFIDKYNDLSINYLIPEKLDSLIRGGRLKGVKKVILTSLNLSPILKVTQKGINLGGLKRTLKGAIKKAILSMLDFIGGEDKIENFDFQIIHGGSNKTVEIAKDILFSLGITTRSTPRASATVIVHTGNGCISLAVSPKIEKL